MSFQAVVLDNVAQASGSRWWDEVGRARAHLQPREVASEPSRPTAVVSNIMSCSTDTSPAATAIEVVMGAHMLGAALGETFGVMQQEQWAASCKCYDRSGVCAHLKQSFWCRSPTPRPISTNPSHTGCVWHARVQCRPWLTTAELAPTAQSFCYIVDVITCA